MKWLPLFLLSALLASVGCAGKKSVKPEAPQSLAEPTPAPQAKAEAAPRGASYVVRRGDSLWKIASKNAVMGDSFHWPLLYRQNRDQVTDPDLIEPGQELGYSKAVSAAEITEAEKLARETPPFVPHSTPRKSLPLKY